MTIDVLGLGETLALYEKTGLAIGVNDIWSKHATPIVVCVDKLERFTPDRRKVIIECKPEMFYSHLSEYQFKHGFKRIHFTDFLDLDQIDFITKSNNSPYVAAGIAYTLGATHIRLWGVDFNTHKALSRDDMRKRSLRDFQSLERELRKKHVFITCAKGSRLSAVMNTH